MSAERKSVAPTFLRRQGQLQIDYRRSASPNARKVVTSRHFVIYTFVDKQNLSKISKKIFFLQILLLSAFRAPLLVRSFCPTFKRWAKFSSKNRARVIVLHPHISIFAFFAAFFSAVTPKNAALDFCATRLSKFFLFLIFVEYFGQKCVKIK